MNKNDYSIRLETPADYAKVEIKADNMKQQRLMAEQRLHKPDIQNKSELLSQDRMIRRELS